MRRQTTVLISVALLLVGVVLPARGQGRPVSASPAAQAPAPAARTPQATPPPASAAQEQAPTEELLGVPFYSGMEFIGSYDAGSGQRYYLFGTNATFADVVSYYKSALKQRGELVFDEPATQMFDIGKFREETMAFPPSLTVKDYTWGGMAGYPNPKPNAEPARFRTIVQIVPIPAAAPPAKR
jgi:hypothetical protein